MSQFLKHAMGLCAIRFDAFSFQKCTNHPHTLSHALSPPNGRPMNVMNITFFRQLKCKQTENKISNVVAAAVAANANVTVVVIVVVIFTVWLGNMEHTSNVLYLIYWVWEFNWCNLHFICVLRLSYIYIRRISERQADCPKKNAFKIDTPSSSSKEYTIWHGSMTFIAR